MPPAGAICQAAQSAGTDLVPVHNAIARRVNDAPVVVMDETGWRVDGEGAWLWVATGPEATAYDVALGPRLRSGHRPGQRDFDGTWVRDGGAVYRRYEAANHQRCLR